MCGIIGYIGAKPVVPVLIDGLRRLEYRGYDSAGVAVVSNGQIEVRRSAGKLAQARGRPRCDPIDGEYGLGHTRWATHGRPTEENAHPHRDCTGRIVVVHNGIIENYLDLKRELQRAGPPLRHRNRHRDRRAPGRARDAGRRSRERRPARAEHLRGLFAIVLMSADDPEKIVAVRNGPPVVVGLGDGEFFVASDIPAILSHTRDVVFLGRRGDGGRHADGRGVHRLSTDGRSRSAVQRVLWDPIMAEKAATSTSCSRRSSSSRTRRARRSSAASRSSRAACSSTRSDLDEAALQAVNKVVVLACGTSWHAGLVGKYMIEQLARVPVEVDYGSEFRYRDPIVDDRTLAVVITQSGETADTLAALREAKKKGARSIAICNVVGSMATREADGTVYTHAGPGDRRRLHQGVHLPARRAVPARAVPGPGARAADAGCGASAHRGTAAPAAPARRGARRRARRWRRSPHDSTPARTSCISAAASTTRSRSRARSS